MLKSQSAEELRKVALAVLANCGWTHVSEDVVEGFAAANGVDLVDRGVVRVLDLLFIGKDGDGKVSKVDVADVEHSDALDQRS